MAIIIIIMIIIIMVLIIMMMMRMMMIIYKLTRYIIFDFQVQHVNSGSYLKKPLEDTNLKEVTLCMCNPPFFSSEDEATLGSARTDKRTLPISVNTGSIMETVTSGGEVEFVKRIVDDSLQLCEKVRLIL
jgi:tRNA1(Val) A37 N6-methylase TrmN6